MSKLEQLIAAGRQVRFTMNSAPEPAKIDVPRRQVTTQVMTAMSENRNGYRMLPFVIAEALDSFMSDWQLIGRDHMELTNSYPLRVWQDGEGHGWITRKVVDDLDWERVLNGYYQGTSWAGTAMAVQIDTMAAAELGREFALKVEPGAYLFDVTYIEDSYVKDPAVHEAVFNSAEEAAEDEPDWLIRQALEGRVQPRVKRPEGMLQRAIASVQGVLTTLMNLNINLAADGGDHNPEEDEMTEEQVNALIAAALTEQAGTIETLTQQVTDLTAQVTALNSADVTVLEAAEVEVQQSLTEERVAEITSAALATALGPVTELLQKIVDQPALSAALESDGGTGAKPGKPRHATV